MDGYEQKFIKIGNGRGIGTYYHNDKVRPVEEVGSDKFQIAKFKHNVIDIINVYRSQSGNSLELLEQLEKQIESGRTTIITSTYALWKTSATE